MSDFADAIMVPRTMAGGGDYRQKMVRILAVARPLMGLQAGDPINVPSDPIGDCYFVRKGKHDNSDSFLFAVDHDRAGEPRHEWTALDNGVQVGHLKPDPAPGP